MRSRDEAVSEIPNWEELRQYARDVKAHTLSRLDHYLEMLEQKISAQGGEVIWAETGQDAETTFTLNRAARNRSVLGSPEAG